MATSYSQAWVEPFTAEMIDEFGGPEELLSCLESLSGKLHRMLECTEEGGESGEPRTSDGNVFASDDPIPAALWLELLASDAVSDPAYWN